MNVFAIIGTMNHEPLRQAIRRNFPDDHLEFASGQWFVAADLTSQQLTEKLRLVDEKMNAVVVGLSSYYGYYSTNVWEWLSLKINA